MRTPPPTTIQCIPTMYCPIIICSFSYLLNLSHRGLTFITHGCVLAILFVHSGCVYEFVISRFETWYVRELDIINKRKGRYGCVDILSGPDRDDCRNFLFGLRGSRTWPGYILILMESFGARPLSIRRILPTIHSILVHRWAEFTTFHDRLHNHTASSGLHQRQQRRRCECEIF